MIPRGADVRRALERYPDVTGAERQALRRWYERARAVELVAALSDPVREPSLARFRRDHPLTSRSAMTLPVLIAAALLMAALLPAIG